MHSVRTLLDSFPDILDHNQQLLLPRAADRLEKLSATELEEVAREAPSSLSLFATAAVKMALSKAWMRACRPRTVHVVFAVYKDMHRISQPSEHPLGQALVDRKVEQLRWLFDGTEHDWSIRVVDDGCPEDSGAFCQVQIDRLKMGDRAHVLRLADAIEANHPAIRGLQSTADSIKGGAIRLGLWEAAETPAPEDVVIYTDSDLSSDLAYLGLLVKPIDDGAVVAAGSRRAPTAICVGRGNRDLRGRLFIYFWKQLLGAPLAWLADSQCSFKAFAAHAVRDLVEDMGEFGLAFDIELLLRTSLAHAGRTAVVPTVWVDLPEASTTNQLRPHLPMLKAVATMARWYGTLRRDREPFHDLINDLDQEGWARLMANPPSVLRDTAPEDYGEHVLVSAQDLRAIAGLG
jgi:hypothetical protein